MNHLILKALDAINDDVFMVDVNQNFKYLNKKAEDYFGKSKELLMNKNIWQELPYLIDTSFYSDFFLLKHINTTINLEGYSSKHQSFFKVRINSMEDGYLVYFFQISKDSQLNLNINQKRFKAIFENSVVGIGLLGLDGYPIEANNALLKDLGYSKEELTSMKFTDYTHHEDVQDHISLVQELIAKKRKSYTIEKRFIRKNGECFWARVTSSLICDSNDNPEYMISVIENIDHMKLVEQKRIELMNEWKRLSSLDGLTGLYNRRTFDQFLDEEWKRCKSQNLPLSLTLIDIDHFKSYNDAHGHLKGDHCLKTVAKTIAEACKTMSYKVFRYGGEEFAIIMPSTGLDEALSISEDLRLSIENLEIKHATSIPNNKFLTISLGVSSSMDFPEISSPYDLITHADEALYVAKRYGRNQVKLLVNDDPF